MKNIKKEKKNDENIRVFCFVLIKSVLLNCYRESVSWSTKMVSQLLHYRLVR